MKRIHFLPAILLGALLLAVISGSVPHRMHTSSALAATMPVNVSVRPATSELCSDDIAAWLMLAARSAEDTGVAEPETVTIRNCSQ